MDGTAVLERLVAAVERIADPSAPKKGTWTVLATMAEGKTCIVAAGQSWQDMPEKVAGTGT